MTLNPLLLIILLAMLSGCEADSRGNDPVAHPDFCLEDGNTHQRFYLNQHKGKVVLLVFWSSNCKYCQLELSALAALKDQMDNDAVVVASILIDPESRSVSAEGSVEGNHIYPVLLDWNRKVADQFNIYAIPTTVVIGPEGNETLRRPGYSRAILNEIQGHLALLIEKKR